MLFSVPDVRKKTRTKDSALSKLLYLSRWPDFTDEDDIAVIASQARVCAFLARKPAAGFLVYRNVDMPHDEAEAILEHLLEKGCVSIFQENFIALAGESSRLVGKPEEKKRGLLRSRSEAPKDSGSASFLGRLWKKLIPDNASPSRQGR